LNSVLRQQVILDLDNLQQEIRSFPIVNSRLLPIFSGCQTIWGRIFWGYGGS
jgi:hypothetical protein